MTHEKGRIYVVEDEEESLKSYVRVLSKAKLDVIPFASGRDALKCLEQDRSVGSVSNRAATRYFADHAKQAGFSVVTEDLPCIRWENGGTELRRLRRPHSQPRQRHRNHYSPGQRDRTGTSPF